MSYRENTQLQKFVSIFLEKNTHINLSAIRDEEGVWVKHIEDSLITLPLFEQFGDKKLKVLDLWTGGGFPGLPLATMLPQHDFTLLDGTRKKVDCVREFAETLGLNNVTPQWGRVEDMRTPSMKEERLHNKNGIVFLDGTPSNSNHYDLVVTRAAAYIEDLFTWIKPLLKSDGRAWIYKQASEEEWADGQQLAKNRGMILTKALIYNLAEQERWVLEIRKK